MTIRGYKYGWLKWRTAICFLIWHVPAKGYEHNFCLRCWKRLEGR